MEDLTVSVAIALFAAVLKFGGDTLEVFSKTSDLTHRPKTRGRLLDIKAILSWIATAGAMVAAMYAVAGGAAAAWSIPVACAVVAIVGFAVLYTAKKEHPVTP